MAVQTAASASIGIVAASPATHDSAGFGALTFITVGEAVSLGEVGGTAALVTHSPLDTRTVQKFKGSLNYGSMAVALGMDISDAGQLLLVAGADGAAIDTDHSVAITLQDGSIMYFQAKVMSYTRNVGSIDQVVGANTTLELVTSIIDA